ncbi:tail fiber domain-containing protein [Oleiharenicola lentus]|uniref:tail fiber domain-containing protein n=1 Tax=Oleiharenicola lentus TaxID=2508720 RepID=UPI003F671E5F
MSFGRANVPSKAPKVANIDASDMASNETGVPVAFWRGPGYSALTWIVPTIYNPDDVPIYGEKQGKGGSKISGYEYYGDVAGVAAVGLLAKLTKIEIDDEPVWTGEITRPDDPDHPDYWRVEVVTAAGTFYVYWGRAEQPEDDILLGPIRELDPTQWHPGYDNEILVVVRRMRLTSSRSAGNVVIYGHCESLIGFGDFSPQLSAQGESMVAIILELLTNPIFGVGLPPSLFDAEEWEQLSAAVVSRVGCHAPFLNRLENARSVVKALLEYFDGWIRFENGRLRAGFYPHDGEIPEGLTMLTVHDFTERPSGESEPPSATVNKVVVMYRDALDNFKRKPSHGSASDSIESQNAVDPRILEAPAIIDSEQAAVFVAEAAATAAEGIWQREGKVRRPRAVWANGDRLQAGDNFQVDLPGPAVNQICRITRRVDRYLGSPSFEYTAERGVFPTPQTPPAPPRPTQPKTLPTPITAARIWEITPELADSPIGLPVVILAKRPPSIFEGGIFAGATVNRFRAWFSTTGSNYGSLGLVHEWATRATLIDGLAANNFDATIQIEIDGDDLDRARYVQQTADEQINDELLLLIGNEVFSVGSITVDGLNYTLGCKRARQGSLPASHDTGDEVWLVYRDELTVHRHRRFVEDTSAYFKLQPLTRGAQLELSEVDAINYSFRDRGPEAPVITIDPLVGSLRTGIPYNISGQISDVNGDLTTYEIAATRYTGVGGDVLAEFSLKSAEFSPDDRALFSFKVPFMFPEAGVWRIRVKAYDATEAFTIEETAELIVEQSQTIDDLAGLIDEVNIFLAQLEDEAEELAENLQQEIIDRGNAITSEAADRADADSALSTSIDAVLASLDDEIALAATRYTALVDADSALATQIDTAFAAIDDNTAAISTVNTALVDETTTRASQVLDLQAVQDDLQSSVDVITAAYLVDGVAIATWGVQFDVNGHAVGLQAIAASGGSQSTVGALILDGLDIQTADFVSGVSGWRIPTSGSPEFNHGYWRGGLQIDSNGSWVPGYAGNTDTGFAVEPTTTSCFISRDGNFALSLNRNSTDGPAAIFHRQGTQVGQISVSGSSTSYVTSSDARRKTDLGEFNLEDVAAPLFEIPLRKYRWQAWEGDFENESRFAYGVFAQEVAEICPWLAHYNAGEDTWGVDWTSLSPNIVAALQLHHADLSALRDRIQALEGA